MTYKSTSFTQVTQKCGRALMYYREGADRGPRGIAPCQGTGGHGGAEHHMVYGDVPAAVANALLDLEHEVELVGGEGRVMWDDPVRLTKPNRDWPMGRPYNGDTGRMPDMATAQTVTRLMVEAWCATFPALRVTPFAYCPRCGARPEGGELRCQSCVVQRPGRQPDYASLLPVERKEKFPLDQWGMPGWVFTVKYDLEPDGGGMVDLKFSKEGWDTREAADGTHRLDPNGHHWDKAEQALLYMLAQEVLYGEPPDWFVFHNLPRSGVVCDVVEGDDGPVAVPVSYDASAIQVVPVDYDRAAAEQVINLRVLPVVRAIEAGIWIPNTSGPFPCSERYCDYWDICPLGRAARGGIGVAPAEPARDAA